MGDKLEAYLAGPIMAQSRQHLGIRNVNFRRNAILQSSTRQTRCPEIRGVRSVYC